MTDPKHPSLDDLIPETTRKPYNHDTWIEYTADNSTTLSVVHLVQFAEKHGVPLDQVYISSQRPDDFDAEPGETEIIIGWDAGMENSVKALSNDHVVEFQEDGWVMQHPLTCRPNLFACELNNVIKALADGIPHVTGDHYRVTNRYGTTRLEKVDPE